MPGSGDTAGFPPRILPMLAVPAAELPEPENLWAAEFKWDGVRALAYLSAGRLRLLSRSDREMSRSYPELADLAGQAGTGDMVLDGEIAAFDGGRPSFAALQRRMHVGTPSPRLVAAVPVTYLVFDIMYADGRPLVNEPYEQRRAILEAQPLAGPHVHVPPSFPGGGQAVLAVSLRDGLEGVVVKRLDSPYQPGRRSPAWLKIKNRRLLDVVVGGISPGRGGRTGRIGSLLVGIPAGPGLVYAGRVGTGFTQPELRALERLLTPLRRDSPPFSGPVPPPQARDVTWVEPWLVIEVSYAEQTPDGILRAAAYQGLKATGDKNGRGPLTASGRAGPARPCRPARDRARRYRPARDRARRYRLPQGRGHRYPLLPGRVRHCCRSQSRAHRHPARACPRSWDRVPYRPPQVVCPGSFPATSHQTRPCAGELGHLSRRTCVMTGDLPGYGARAA